MKTFAIFDVATGRVLQNCTAPDAANARTAARPGQDVREVAQDFALPGAYFDGTTAKYVPPQPSPNHVFNWVTKAWEDPRTLQEIKDAASKRVNAARVQANFGTFTYAGKTFACDTASRADIDTVNGYVALFNALPPGFSGAWKAVDNSDVPIPTVAVWKLFYAALAVAGIGNFAKAQALKDKLDKAKDPKEVKGTGW